MNYQRVDAGSGWTWIKEGLEIFMKNPGIWIVLGAIWLVIAIVLRFVPLIGPVVATLIGPALAGGMLYGARELERGRSLEIPHLFKAFSDSTRTLPMVLLGLVPVAVGLIFGLLLAALIGSALIAGSEDAAYGLLTGGGIVLILLWLLAALVVGAALLFAVPLVMFKRAEPIAAMQTSLQACIGNVGAFIVYMVIILVLGFVLGLIPWGLGFVLLAPVAICAVYAAYRQVIGLDETGAEIESEPERESEPKREPDTEPPPAPERESTTEPPPAPKRESDTEPPPPPDEPRS